MKKKENKDVIDFRRRLIEAVYSDIYTLGPACNDGSMDMSKEKKKVLEDLLVEFNVHFSTRGYDLG